MIVSGGQQRDSAIHTHVSISPQTPLPSRLPDNIEQSSLCYTVGPFWLFVLNTVMCTSPSQIPNLSLSPAFLLVTISSFSKSVGLFYKLICIIFLDPRICDIMWYLSVSVWLTSLSMTISMSIHVAQMTLFCSFFMAE